MVRVGWEEPPRNPRTTNAYNSWLRNKLAASGFNRLTYGILLGILSPLILVGIAITFGHVWSREIQSGPYKDGVVPDWVPRTKGLMAAAVLPTCIGAIIFGLLVIVALILSCAAEFPARCLCAGPHWVITGRAINTKPWMFR